MKEDQLGLAADLIDTDRIQLNTVLSVNQSSSITVESEHENTVRINESPTPLQGSSTRVDEGEEPIEPSSVQEDSLWAELINSSHHFSWDDFLYSLILGLGPSAWDVSTAKLEN